MAPAFHNAVLHRHSTTNDTATPPAAPDTGHGGDRWSDCHAPAGPPVHASRDLGPHPHPRGGPRRDGLRRVAGPERIGHGRRRRDRHRPVAHPRLHPVGASRVTVRRAVARRARHGEWRPRPGRPRGHRLGPAARPVRPRRGRRLAQAHARAARRDAARGDRGTGRRVGLHVVPGRADRLHPRRRRRPGLGRRRRPRRHAVGRPRGGLHAGLRARVGHHGPGRRHDGRGQVRGGCRQRLRPRDVQAPPGERRPRGQGDRVLAVQHRDGARDGPRRREGRHRRTDGRGPARGRVARARVRRRLPGDGPREARRRMDGRGRRGHATRTSRRSGRPTWRSASATTRSSRRTCSGWRRPSAPASGSSTSSATPRPHATRSTAG